MNIIDFRPVEGWQVVTITNPNEPKMHVEPMPGWAIVELGYEDTGVPEDRGESWREVLPTALEDGRRPVPIASGNYGLVCVLAPGESAATVRRAAVLLAVVKGDDPDDRRKKIWRLP